MKNVSLLSLCDFVPHLDVPWQLGWDFSACTQQKKRDGIAFGVWGKSQIFPAARAEGAELRIVPGNPLVTMEVLTEKKIKCRTCSAWV